MRDAYGHRLALVFANEYARGRCPFHQKQCIHCDIGAGEGFASDPELNERRLEFFTRHYARILPEVVHLVVYNSGSTLNEKEMSRATLKSVLVYAAGLGNVKVVSCDSRESFVSKDVLDFLLAHVRDDQHVRVILGIESQSDQVRMGSLQKRMTKASIERVFSARPGAGQESRRARRLQGEARRAQRQPGLAPPGVD